jgi:ribosomal protein S18 acetylase RimI-like enzyme
MVSRGRMHYPHELKGFVAMSGNKPVGLVTYRIEGSECEIVTLDSVVEGHGIGSGLIGAVKSAAMSAKCHRIWLITTNDNTPALGFYQKRGFALVSVYPNAIEQSRKLKPEIPMVGLDGIPLRDEIELEMPLRHSA